MFDIGWGHLLILALAGLFILGPERLPEVASALGRTARRAREYASGAQQQLRAELGPEFDDIRKPLEDLRALRGMDPKRVIARHVLDATGGYDPRTDLRIDPGGSARSDTAPSDTAPSDTVPFDNDAT